MLTAGHLAECSPHAGQVERPSRVGIIRLQAAARLKRWPTLANRPTCHLFGCNQAAHSPQSQDSWQSAIEAAALEHRGGAERTPAALAQAAAEKGGGGGLLPAGPCSAENSPPIDA